MACTALEAIVKGCDNNIGSITKIYINDLDNVTIDPSTDIDLATWTITAIAASPVFEEFGLEETLQTIQKRLQST